MKNFAKIKVCVIIHSRVIVPHKFCKGLYESPWVHFGGQSEAEETEPGNEEKRMKLNY